MTSTTKDLVYITGTSQLVQVTSDTSYELVVTKADADSIGTEIPRLQSLPTHLTTNKVVILDSVNSGTGRSTDKNLYEQLIKPLFDNVLRVKHEYIATVSAETITEYAHKFDNDEPTTIIFISGDTSVNEFINGLEESQHSSTITIFPFPSGTGNSLALSIDLTDEVNALQKLITSTKVSPLNLYEVEFPKGSYYLVRDEKTTEITQPLKFLVVLSWAFHASLVADSDTPELRKFGLERFKKAAFANLEQEQKYEGEFIINNGQTTISGPFAYWLITASKRFEPTFEISPQGDILEDSLYLVSFNTEDNGTYIMDIMGKVYSNGSHINDHRVSYKKLQKHDTLTLKARNLISKQKRRFCLDGSIIELPATEETELKFSVSDNVYKNRSIYIIN